MTGTYIKLGNRCAWRMTEYRAENRKLCDIQEKYENLANAIILRAVEDYRLTDREQTLRKIERFFRSEWFAILTKMDPEYLITELRKEKQ